MKKKAAVIIIALLLVVVLAVQVGFAANNDEGRAQNRGCGQGNQEICLNQCENLSPEEQEQVRAAREEFREKRDALREELRAGCEALREGCLNRVPETVRERMQERAGACKGQHQRQGQIHGQHGHGNYTCPWNEKLE